MKKLKAGDIRKQGDEVRQRWLGGNRHTRSTEPESPGEWNDVSLVGWPILPADLFNAEFRRP